MDPMVVPEHHATIGVGLRTDGCPPKLKGRLVPEAHEEPLDRRITELAASITHASNSAKAITKPSPTRYVVRVTTDGSGFPLP